MKEFIKRIDFDKGLSSDVDMLRNAETFDSMNACFIEGKVLKTHEASTVVDLGLGGVFPYPQVFALKAITIVCTATAIYELVNGMPVVKLSGLIEGHPWSVADFFKYIVLSNGKQTVVRSAEDLLYTVSTEIPTTNCCVNLNGQLLVGAPTTVVGVL